MQIDMSFVSFLFNQVLHVNIVLSLKSKLGITRWQ